MRKYGKALTNLILTVLCVMTVFFLLPRLLFFLTPFVVGAGIAWMAGPVVRFFEEKIKLKRRAGSVFVIVFVITLILLLFYLVGMKLVTESISMMQSLPRLWENIEADFSQIRQNLNVLYARLPNRMQAGLDHVSGDIGNYIGNLLTQISSPTIVAVSNFAKQLPGLLIGLIMTLLSAYFFIADREWCISWLQKQIPLIWQQRFHIVRRSVKKSVGGYLKAQCKIEIWIYLLVSIGLKIMGVEYAFLLGVGIAVLDVLPFLGTGTVMIPWAVLKILSEDYRLGVGLLIIWCVSQLVRQFIQPKIVGDSVGIRPIPTLFLLYIGYRLYGVIGMLLAVPIGLLLYTLYEEGAFETTRYSVQILICGINDFRKLEKEDVLQESASPPVKVKKEEV